MRESLLSLLLFSFASVVAPGPQNRRRTTDSLMRCSLVDYTSQAQCVHENNRLVCRGGFTSNWIKDRGIRNDVTYLQVLEWPGECLNVGRLQNLFPALTSLEFINCTTLKQFKGRFSSESQIQATPPVSAFRKETFHSSAFYKYCNYGIYISKFVNQIRIQYYWNYNVLRLIQQTGFDSRNVWEKNITSLKGRTFVRELLRRDEKISMHGMLSLWEVSPDVVIDMPDLIEMDLRRNMLRHMKALLLSGPPRLDKVYLSENRWDCSDGGLDWLAMESENGTIKSRIADYHKLVCHQRLYRGKPLHIVMDIIRNMRETCPEPCVCEMTHVVSDAAGAVIPLITVDCAGRELLTPPTVLPPNTTTLRLEDNQINSIRSIVHNPQYKKLADLYLDNNSISAVKELEGSEWFTSFRVLSLRGNNLKQIPVYAFDKALQVNNNIMHVYLGHNPWRCDCHFIPRFQGLLRKYKRVIRDLPDIRCSLSSDLQTSSIQISTISLGNICTSGKELPISPINIANIVLLTLLVLVVGRFFYDWYSFKTTGKLPWLSKILP